MDSTPHTTETKPADFDGEHASCDMLMGMFNAATLGDPRQIQPMLENKLIEVAAVLKMMDTAKIPTGKRPRLDNKMADLVVFCVSAIVHNVDLDRIEANAEPCGMRGCKCHEVKVTTLHSLSILRGYLDAHRAKHGEESGIEFINADNRLKP